MTFQSTAECGPAALSTLRGWKLLYLCLGTFAPTYEMALTL